MEKVRITYNDKDGAFRTTYAQDFRRIAGCVKFTALTPSGQKNGRFTMSASKVRSVEVVE